MVNRERNASLKGSHDNVVNTGDTNYYYSNTPPKLNRSRLYEFCKEFVEIEGLEESAYSLVLPSDIADKIEYNELKEYKEIFIDVSHTLEDVDRTLSQIPKRGNIIRRIKSIYLNFQIEKNEVSKNELCRLVFDELFQIIDYSNDENKLYVEDTSFAIQSLMYHAFTKCQILDRVPNTLK